jgi:hypothetical protein
MAAAFEAYTGDLVVVMMVMVLVFLFEEMRVDLHGVIKIKSSNIKNRWEVNLRVDGPMQRCHRVDSTGELFKRLELRRRHQITFVEKDDVCEGDLLLGLLTIIEMKQDVPGIDNRDHGVNREFRLDFVVSEESLNDWPRIGQSCGLDENAIELVPAFQQIAKDADEISPHRAADAAVVHFEEFLFGIDDELVVDADLSEFILDHGNTQAMLLRKNPVEERGFAGSQKTGEDGDRNASFLSLATCANERGFATACLTKNR